MKKLVLVFGIFLFFVAESKAQVIKEPVFYCCSPCTIQKVIPPLGFSFYFHPAFIRTSFTPKPYTTSFVSDAKVYRDFEMMNFEFDKNAVFCQMENECTKRYGFMLSIHAGGYRER